MMRGFEYVGVIRDVYSWEYEMAVDGDVDKVKPGDVIRVSFMSHGPLRPGMVQVASVGDDLIVVRDNLRHAIPTIASGDHVFRAIALGEDVFRVPS
jgi:hypothetical protein